MATVTSERVADFWDLFESRAAEYAPRAAKEAERSYGLFNMPAGAEFDDLVQVAAMSGLDSLRKGYIPMEAVIDNALNNHLRIVFKALRAEQRDEDEV